MIINKVVDQELINLRQTNVTARQGLILHWPDPEPLADDISLNCTRDCISAGIVFVWVSAYNQITICIIASQDLFTEKSCIMVNFNTEFWTHYICGVFIYCTCHSYIWNTSLCMNNSILLTPAFCRKNLFVSITFNFRDNSPKVGLIFHKHLSFDHFEAFCTNFLHDFQSCWPPSYSSKIFLTPHFYKTLDPIGSIFHHLLDPHTENLVKWTPLEIYRQFCSPLSNMRKSFMPPHSSDMDGCGQMIQTVFMPSPPPLVIWGPYLFF